MMLQYPWYLVLLVFLPWFAWRLFRKRPGGLRFSATGLMRQMAPTLRQRMTWLPPLLTLASIVCMIVALARPREGRERTVVEGEGIAMEMVVDRSGSMQAMDFQLNGEPVDRLTAIKNVAGKFVNGGDKLEGRFNDLIGLIVFARYADSETPPTLDHSFLTSQLNRTQIVNSRREDGTAIGDAISLAIEKLNALDQRQAEKVKSKVIVLLTDGESNAGELDPLQAAELAQTMGIKV